MVLFDMQYLEFDRPFILDPAVDPEEQEYVVVQSVSGVPVVEYNNTSEFDYFMPLDQFMQTYGCQVSYIPN